MTRSHWTPAEVPDQTDRVALVTGATRGVGQHLARQLAAAGATLVLAGRSDARRAAAVSWLRAHVPTAELVPLSLDLADLASVRAAAAEVARVCDRIDVLVNNAGLMGTPLRATADGFELQFGVNHLGHFALTGLLLDHLLAAPAPRMVTVSSAAHLRGTGRFDAHIGAAGYRRWRAYAESKLANLLFTRELQRRADAAGMELTAAAAHPGLAATGLLASGPRLRGSQLRINLAERVSAAVGQPAEQGAWPVLYAATMPDVVGGDYLVPDGLAQLRGRPVRAATSRRARDAALARSLWEDSEALTGVRFDKLDDEPG